MQQNRKRSERFSLKPFPKKRERQKDPDSLFGFLALSNYKEVVRLAETGRPTSYKPEYDQLAFNYSLLGATDKELANYFDVSESTINEWKIKHQSFSESIKDGKEKADARIAQSLYKKALGYKQKTQKAMQYQGDVVIAEVEEEVPPDTTAAIFWLKNRRGKDWRDKQDIVLAPAEDVDVDSLKKELADLIKGLTPAERKALVDE